MRFERISNWIAAIGVVLWASLGWSGRAMADVVDDWNETAATLIAASGPAGWVPIAITHVAIYDAVNSIDKNHTAYAVTAAANTKNASQEAAVATVAHGVLLSLFPNEKALLDRKYAESLATVPDGSAETLGIAVGEEVAARILALRAGDGRDASAAYTYLTVQAHISLLPRQWRKPLHLNWQRSYHLR